MLLETPWIFLDSNDNKKHFYYLTDSDFLHFREIGIHGSQKTSANLFFPRPALDSLAIFPSHN